MNTTTSSPTWANYLVEMSSYLSAVRRAAEVGTEFPLAPPARPTGSCPEDYHDEVRQLADTCDQLVVQVSVRMTTITNRPPATRQSPHQKRPFASYVDTDI
ncbi:MAG TPA: hypothetical protein VMU68_11595 [Acidimicrobiales bacterium]|nr:hypothetical protein [Acidimicrobiales bacterium]